MKIKLKVTEQFPAQSLKEHEEDISDSRTIVLSYRYRRE